MTLEVRQDKTRQDKTRQDKTRQDKTRQRHLVGCSILLFHRYDKNRSVLFSLNLRNTSTNFMEWCEDWFLIHLTEPEMVLLCEQAETSRKNISSVGVNIFCKAMKR